MIDHAIFTLKEENGNLQVPFHYMTSIRFVTGLSEDVQPMYFTGYGWCIRQNWQKSAAQPAIMDKLQRTEDSSPERTKFICSDWCPCSFYRQLVYWSWHHLGGVLEGHRNSEYRREMPAERTLQGQIMAHGGEMDAATDADSGEFNHCHCHCWCCRIALPDTLQASIWVHPVSDQYGTGIPIFYLAGIDLRLKKYSSVSDMLVPVSSVRCLGIRSVTQ